MTAPTLGSTEPSFLARIADRPVARHLAGGTIHATPLQPEVLEEFTRHGLEGLRAQASVSWEQGDGTRLFGIGVAARFGAPRGAGGTGPGALLRRWKLRDDGDVAQSAVPRLFGGFQFDPDAQLTDARWEPFGAWQFVLPRILVAWGPAGAVGTICALDDATANDESQPALGGSRGVGQGLSPAGWGNAVACAVAEIRARRYAKTVLARQRNVALPAGWAIGDTVSALATRYPSCFVFRFDSPDGTWLGASPERLVSLGAGVARADSVAGSCPRGATTEEDVELEERLTNDPKERAEHAFVIDAIASSLAPHTRLLEHPTEPAVMKLANIQHLHTPVTATVKPGVSILDLLGAVHPTPAVGGWPRKAAVDAIRRLECMDRGWYAGPIGWMDLNGNGEFAVGLRSALVQHGRATLFAGAGIVADSEPERELAELDLKFRPLEEALNIGSAWK